MNEVKITISGQAGAGTTTIARVVHELLSTRLPAGFTVVASNDPALLSPAARDRNVMALAGRGTKIAICEAQTQRAAEGTSASAARPRDLELLVSDFDAALDRHGVRR